MKKIIKEKEGYGTVQRDFMQMQISVYAKCVYTLLRTYSGQKNACYPSMKTICEDLMISKPTLIKAINELEKIDMIAVKRSKKKDSNENSVNTYIPLSIMVEIDLENLDFDNEFEGLGGKGDLLRGKGDLLGVVNDVYRKNNNIKNNKEDITITDQGSVGVSSQQELFSTPEPEVLSFDEFWNMYDKKEGRFKCEKKFKALSGGEKKMIKEFLPNYILRTPNKQYRKNPETWINSKGWLDEKEHIVSTSIAKNVDTSSMDNFYSFQNELYKHNNQA